MKAADVIISVCAQACLIALMLSMLSTALDLQSNRNERKLSAVPYLTLLVNCSVWSLYAAAQGLIALFLPNALGIFIGMYCSLVYYQNSRIPLPTEYMMIAVATILTSLVFVSLGYTELVGFIAILLSTGVYASPLATLKTVLEEKSTKSMPFYTSLLVWLSALFWTLYGAAVAYDVNVLIPSLLGFILASVQMYMFFLYGINREAIDSDAAKPEHVYQSLHGGERKEATEVDPLNQEMKSYQKA
jgi:solute carrier family 50 protein (sugar transporter)